MVLLCCTRKVSLVSLFLYKIGRLSFRRPLIFLAVWVLALAGVVGLTLAAGGVKISSSITIDGTESQNVIDELRSEFPDLAGGQGTIVFVSSDGERLDDGDRANAIRDAATELAGLQYVVEKKPVTGQVPPGGAPADQTGADAGPGIPAAGPPTPDTETPSQQPPTTPGDQIHPLMVAAAPVPGVLVSADGSVAMMQVQFTEQVEDLPAGAIEEVVSIAEAHTGSTGIQTLTTESLKPHQPPLGGHEALGLLVAALVLFLTLGSLRAAGLPLLTGLIGVGIGLGGAFALSHTIPLTSATPVLALMVGLAVGIDYALFIVNRQRRLILTSGVSAEEATGRAVGTAGSAVIFAGLTVVIALTGLTLIGISFLTTMALVAAVTVVVAVLVSLTLLPALLGFIGERIVSKKAREKGATLTTREHRGFAHKFASTVVRGRWVAILVVIGVLSAAAVPMASMSLGMPNGSTANLDTHERRAYDAITDGFGEGYNAPLITVIRSNANSALNLQDVAAAATQLETLDAVDSVKPMGISADGTLAVVTVIPKTGPDADATAALVHTLRADGAAFAGIPGATLGVTGLTAVNLDISEKLASVLPLYISIIVILSLIVLMLVFRSILIPIKATLGFLLTIGATFGIITAVFQWGWFKDLLGFDTTGPILSFLPIMVTGILYGLAMDYEMFLVSSMREAHVHGHQGNDTIVHGFDQAGRVVLAAAVIMVSVFAGFAFSEDPMVKQFGLALAVGITIDAFLIRMTLVPALMSVLGRAAWWLPKWLDRILPNLDVEGDRLTRHLDAQQRSLSKA